MKITVPKAAVVLVLLGGAWWLARADSEPSADADPGVTRTAERAAALRGMRPRLELAVASALNSAECGYSAVGYEHRTPEESARRLVALMASASAPPPGRERPPGSDVEYVEGLPGAPWQVTINPAPDGTALVIEGYGLDLSEPLLTRRVPCS